MITLITGKDSAANTRLAAEIVKGSKAVWVDEINLNRKYGLSEVDPDTEYIVVPDATDIDKIDTLFEEQIWIEKKHYAERTMDMPNIIITSKTLKPRDFFDLDFVSVKVKEKYYDA